ncbi:MAG: hypothetical protein AAF658_03405 [Myxococcota bacterium]
MAAATSDLRRLLEQFLKRLERAEGDSILEDERESISELLERFEELELLAADGRKALRAQHDLCQPIGAILLNAQVLLERAAEFPESVRAQLEAVQDAVLEARGIMKKRVRDSDGGSST